jgi:hypothetical protein
MPNVLERFVFGGGGRDGMRTRCEQTLLRERRPEIFNEMARLARLERAASCLEGSCSIHLSYRRVAPV